MFIDIVIFFVPTADRIKTVGNLQTTNKGFLAGAHQWWAPVILLNRYRQIG
jgi:hypothetical protein